MATIATLGQHEEDSMLSRDAWFVMHKASVKLDMGTLKAHLS